MNKQSLLDNVYTSIAMRISLKLSKKNKLHNKNRPLTTNKRKLLKNLLFKKNFEDLLIICQFNIFILF